MPARGGNGGMDMPGMPFGGGKPRGGSCRGCGTVQRSISERPGEMGRSRDLRPPPGLGAIPNCGGGIWPMRPAGLLVGVETLWRKVWELGGRKVYLGIRKGVVGLRSRVFGAWGLRRLGLRRRRRRLWSRLRIGLFRGRFL